MGCVGHGCSPGRAVSVGTGVSLIGGTGCPVSQSGEETTLRYYYKWVRQTAANPLANEAD